MPFIVRANFGWVPNPGGVYTWTLASRLTGLSYSRASQSFEKKPDDELMPLVADQSPYRTNARYGTVIIPATAGVDDLMAYLHPSPSADPAHPTPAEELQAIQTTAITPEVQSFMQWLMLTGGSARG